MTFTIEKPQEIETHLGQNPYLSQGGLPGAEDARIYLELNQQPPELTKTPNFHHWPILEAWSEKSAKPVQQPSAVLPQPTQPKPQEKKPQPAEDDLFGDTPTPVAPPIPVQQKKKKEKPVAKSIVFFQVKVHDQQTNLDTLAQKILSRQINGLVWNKQPQKIDIAYGMQKLQMTCVIQDDKVLTDDIFEPIQQWEEVQSVDMVSMQKV